MEDAKLEQGEITPDGMPVNHRALCTCEFIHTQGQFTIANLPTCMLLDNGKKPVQSQEKQAKGKHFFLKYIYFGDI